MAGEFKYYEYENNAGVVVARYKAKLIAETSLGSAFTDAQLGRTVTNVRSEVYKVSENNGFKGTHGRFVTLISTVDGSNRFKLIIGTKDAWDALADELYVPPAGWKIGKTAAQDMVS